MRFLATLSTSMNKDTFARIEEDDEGYDAEEDEDSACTWNLSFGPSVYDDSILMIVDFVPSTSYNSSGVRHWCTFLTIPLVIFANFLLQSMVVYEVHCMNTHAKDDTLQKVFGPPLASDGSCWKRDNKKFPGFLPLAGKGPDSSTWDCSPLLPVLLSNVEWLDADEDGYWSADEAKDMKDFDEDKFGVLYKGNLTKKAGSMPRAFDRILAEIKDNKFLLKRTPAEKTLDTERFVLKQIPMEYMRAEQPILSLCINVDKELCGNLEIRGVLKVHIKDKKLTPGDRVDKCRTMYDRCDNLFGELFRNYNDYATAICGDKDSKWDSKRRVTQHTYAKATLYKPGDKDAVTNRNYLVFLGLILALWWLKVLEEMNRVFSWLMALFIMPCNDNIVTDTTADPIGGVLSVSAITNPTKAVIFIFIMIPRAGIILALSWIGTQFLIGADSYTDLVMNGVALSFISDIDEIMFAALMSQRAKDAIEKAEVLCIHEGCGPLLVAFCNLPTTPAAMLFVVGMVSAAMLAALYGPTGKYEMALAYECLCHAGGPNCLSAQLLCGGDPQCLLK